MRTQFSAAQSEWLHEGHRPDSHYFDLGRDPNNWQAHLRDAAHRVNDMTGAIDSNCAEHSLAITQLAQAVAELVEVIQQYAAMVEQDQAACSMADWAQGRLRAVKAHSVENKNHETDGADYE